MRGNTGPGELASAIAAIARRQAGALDQDWLDLGTILPDGSLKLDRFLRPFPPGDYYLCERLAAPDPLVTTEPAAVGDHGLHQHDVPRPDAARPLAPGDRVLVAWATSVDPVVVDRLART